MISVCIATYNGERYIASQLDSILKQLSDVDEVIISDDGSTDKTLKIVRDFCDKRISIYKGPQNGLIKNFENALMQAKGDYIFLSDQDDVWMPSKVTKVLEILKTNHLVISDAEIIDQEGAVIMDSFFKINASRIGLFKNLVKNSYIGCAMAFDKFTLEKVLPFPKHIAMHDWWIGLVAEKIGRVVFLEEKLLKYRKHNANVSNTLGKSRYSLLKKLIMRAYLLIKLISIKKG